MTVSSSNDRITYAGNGTAQIFDLTFSFFTNTDIQAFLIDDATGDITSLSLGTNYTLSGAGQPELDGSPVGQLTMLAPPGLGTSLFIQRVIPITQPTDVVNQGRFFPEIHENVFDRLTMQIQQGIGSLGKALRVIPSEPSPNFLPIIPLRKNKLLSFDENGNPVAVAPTSGSAEDLALSLYSSGGSSLVGFAQPEDGAVARFIYDKIIEQAVTPEDYGAAAAIDLGIDDSAFVQAAFATGRPVLLEREYLIDGVTLDIQHPATVIGRGTSKSGLLFENMGGILGNDCINVTLGAGSEYRASSLFSDFSMRFKDSDARGGIVTPQGGNIWLTYAPRYLIKRCNFSGYVEQIDFGRYDFTCYDFIRMGESIGSLIKDCNFFGSFNYAASSTSDQQGSGAICFDTTTTTTGGGGVLLPQIDHCFGHYQGTAVRCGYRVSQPIISNSQFHRNYYSVYSPHYAADNPGGHYGSDEMIIHDCNLNSQRTCVLHAPGGFLSLNAVRMTRSGGGYDHGNNWYGVYADGMIDVKLIDVRTAQLGTNYTNSNIGMYLKDIRKLTVLGVYTRNDASGSMPYGIIVDEPQYATISNIHFNGSITNGLEIRRAVQTTSDVRLFGLVADSGTTNKLSLVGTITRRHIKWPDEEMRYAGVDASALAISAAGTTSHQVFAGNQVRRYSFNTGAGPYTHNLDLSNTGAQNGDVMIFHITQVATNPTVVIRDGSGATVLTLAPTGATQRWRVDMAFTAGGAWRCIGAMASVI